MNTYLQMKTKNEIILSNAIITIVSKECPPVNKTPERHISKKIPSAPKKKITTFTTLDN